MDMQQRQRSQPAVSRAAVVGLIVIVVIAGALAAAAWFAAQPHPVPIGKILKEIREYDGQAVTIKGTVSNPLNLGGMLKVYEVTDDSGKIRVVTKRGLPEGGETVVVKGLVREVFNIAGINMTVIVEPQEEQ